MDPEKIVTAVSSFLAVVAFITMIACIVWAVRCGDGKVAMMGGCFAFIMMSSAILMAMHECQLGYGALSYGMAVAAMAYVLATGDTIGFIPTLLMGGVSVLLVMSLIRKP